MKQQKRKIDINTVNRVKCEHPLNIIENSIFKEIYKRADQLLYDMVLENADRNTMDQLEDEQASNVISFLGARGRGKTSAMLSFLFSLNELQSEKNNWSRFREYKKNPIRFLTLPYIDAAILAENEYVLDIFLAKMWDEYQKHIEESLNTSNDALYVHLQQHVKTGFVNVRKAYKVLKRKETKDSKETDEPIAGALRELSVSMNLRYQLKELVNDYIKLMNYGKWNNQSEYDSQCFLVLAIDDIDMSATEANRILEEIRRFFSIPQVIIFLTADMERLKKMCESYFTKCLGNAAWDTRNLYRFINDYLGKVLPYHMRIHMPELQENFDGYMIQKKIDIKKWKKIGIDVEKLNEKDLILSVIWKTCGIALDGERRRHHFLQNSSLREMINYFERLFNLDAGQYFAWLKTDLKDRLIQRIDDETQRVFIENLCSVDYEDMNNAVINFIQGNLIGDKKLRTQDKCLGQVLYACSLAEAADAENMECVNCILLLYSMMLAQIGQNDKLMEKIVGNSLFGEWEYSALPTGDPGTELLTGFDTRNQLELVISYGIMDLLKDGKAEQAAVKLLEKESAKIQGWLYSLLFVNISSPAGERFVFTCRGNEKLTAAIADNPKIEYHKELVNFDFSWPAVSIEKNKTQQPTISIQTQQPTISIQMHGIARKSCFGFLHENQQKEITKLEQALQCVCKEIVRSMFLCCGEEFDETNWESKIESQYEKIWAAIKEKTEDIEPFPVQNVEILYSIGKEMEQVTAVDDGKSPELLFEKMMHVYRIIAATLKERDSYYKRIGIKLNYAENFEKRIRSKIFLDSDYLEKEVKDSFIKQFGSMYSAVVVRLQEPKK